MSDNLLKAIAQAGIYYLPQARRSGLEKAAGKIHFHMLTANIAECHTSAVALQQLGSALHFPIWYGANFDALYDCLTDANWQPGKGHVLLINGIESLRQAEPEGFATMIEVFQAAAEARREAGNPFWILLDTPTRGITTLPEA